MVIDNILKCASELTGSYGITGYKPNQVDIMALTTAKCLLINNDIEMFTNFMFIKEGLRFVNLSSNNIIQKSIFTPWGSSGKSKLQRADRDVIRRYYYTLSRPKPLYYCIKTHWYVNTVTYPTIDHALNWCKNFEITPTIWFNYHITNYTK